MRRAVPSVIVTLLAAALAAMGYAYWQGQQRRNAVIAQLGQMAAYLDAPTRQADLEARRVLRQLQENVCRNNKQVNDVAVLQEAEHIRARTYALLDTLQALQRQLQGSRAEAEAAARASMQLAAQFKRYEAYIGLFVPMVPGMLSQYAEQSEFLLASALPLAAKLSVLTRQQAQIRQYEAEALLFQSQKMGPWCGVYPSRAPVAVPDADTVAPGAEYRALLFLGEASTYPNGIRMTANGQDLPVDQRARQGQVALRVPALPAGTPGSVRAQWQGTIRGHTCFGDTTWQVTVPYFIAKSQLP